MASHVFTRQELYDLVWSEPMIKLAARTPGMINRTTEGLRAFGQRGTVMASHAFRRQELYDLVWSEPMIKLSRTCPPSDDFYGLMGRAQFAFQSISDGPGVRSKILAVWKNYALFRQHSADRPRL